MTVLSRLMMAETYRDGVQTERCTQCGAALRTADDYRLVEIRRDDLERLIVYYIDLPEECSDMIQRCEEALGRTVKQMKAQIKAVW